MTSKRYKSVKYVFLCMVINFFIQKSIYAEANQKTFDLIIIGGGSAAFNAAAKALKLQKKVLIINEGLRLGGTCVNVGCMPSKYLIKAAESIYIASYNPYPGIKIRKPNIDFQKLIRAKKLYVNKIWSNKYPPFIKSQKNLEVIIGWAKLCKQNNSICVTVNKKKYFAKKYLIATGSRPRIPKIRGLKNIKFLTSRTLLDLEKKPKTLTIVGAGYIGLELATIYSQLGINIRIIEKSNRILSKEDNEISYEMEKQLKRMGIQIFKNCAVVEVIRKDKDLILLCKDKKSNEKFKILEKGHLVLASGIRPNTQNLGFEEIGILRDDKERIIVNKKMETSLKNVYAAGDCINTSPYLYTAVREGQIAVQNAFSPQQIEIDYKGLPWVMFTNPEFAGSGLNEQESRKLNIPYQVSIIPLRDVTKTSTSLDKRGLIKLIIDKRTNRIIGGRAIGHNAGELAIQISYAIKYSIRLKDLQENFYPYLTLSEGIQIAAQNFKS